MDRRPPAPVACRIEAPVSLIGGEAPDYADAFEVTVTDRDRRTAEQWARAVFEEAPPIVRLCLVVGWRRFLGLRLGPRRSPDHVLGWTIVSADPEMIRLELESPLMAAGLVFRVSASTALMTTGVRYRRSMARPLWGVVGPIHRTVVPRLFRRAADLRRRAAPSSD